MGRIRDFINEGKKDVQTRCIEIAKYIFAHEELEKEIRESVMENHSEVTIRIDHLVGWGPTRNREWELMIEHLTIMLENEGVKMEMYGWEKMPVEEQYLIHLSW